MKKKILAIGLAAALSLSLLTGCTGDQQKDDPKDNSSGTAVTAPSTDPTAATLPRPTGEYTGGPAWGKPVSKASINFEGRVASVEEGKLTLEDGTVVLTDGAEISAPDGSAAEIAVGDYIQGYAEDPDAAELNAAAILITAL